MVGGPCLYLYSFRGHMTSSGVAIRHGPLMAHGIHAQAALPSKLPGAPSVRAQQLCDARAMSVRYSSCAPQRLLLAWLLVRTMRALRNACSCTIPPFHRIPHLSEHDAIPTGPPAHMPSSPAPSFLVVWGKPPILHMMGSGMASILGGGFGPHGGDSGDLGELGESAPPVGANAGERGGESGPRPGLCGGVEAGVERGE